MTSYFVRLTELTVAYMRDFFKAVVATTIKTGRNIDHCRATQRTTILALMGTVCRTAHAVLDA